MGRKNYAIPFPTDEPLRNFPLQRLPFPADADRTRHGFEAIASRRRTALRCRYGKSICTAAACRIREGRVTGRYDAGGGQDPEIGGHRPPHPRRNGRSSRHACRTGRKGSGGPYRPGRAARLFRQERCGIPVRAGIRPDGLTGDHERTPVSRTPLGIAGRRIPAAGQRYASSRGSAGPGLVRSDSTHAGSGRSRSAFAGAESAFAIASISDSQYAEGVLSGLRVTDGLTFCKKLRTRMANI